ncbi:MAG: hypothetical protein CMH54_10985 [Myxococcales bacterium]|nr:hypothetical protein [Myxococcales bacterium]
MIADLIERGRARGIRTRLGIFATLAVVTVMGVAGAWLDQAYSDRAHEEVRRRSAALLQSFAVPCAIAVAVDDLEDLDTYMVELSRAGAEHLGVLHVAMLDHDGKLLAQSWPSDLPKQDGVEPEESFYELAAGTYQPIWKRYVSEEGLSVMQVSMPAVSGLRWGTLVAHFNLTPVIRQIRTTRLLQLVITTILAGVVVFVLFIGLWHIVVRPVRSMARTAMAIRGGDLAARTEVVRGDELGELATTFNSMAEELQEYTQELEEKVSRRTSELAAKNRELGEVNSKLQEAVEKLDRLARTDRLTGLYNRGHFMERLDEEIQRSQRSGSPFGLIICDVDFFKSFNDNFGHQVGDAVLQQLAQVMLESLRTTDVVARYGGEEFVALLPGTDMDDSLQVAEQLRESVELTPFVGPDGEDVGEVRVSGGVAAFPDHAKESTVLLHSADMALYYAKKHGRNRMILWSTELDPVN